MVRCSLAVLPDKDPLTMFGMTNDNKQTDKVYDSVFWTALNKLSAYAPFLINEVFGEHFTKDATVTFLSSKEVVTLADGKLGKRDVDSFFRLTEDYIDKVYHFECEVYGRKGVALRIAEYATGYAFGSAELTDDGARITIPNSAVIFLRTDSADVDEFRMWIDYPGASVSYKVPVIKIKDYSLDELFEKKLLILVPFYVFKISDKSFSEMDEDIEKLSKIKGILADINGRLETLVEAGELEIHHKGSIMVYIENVLEKLAAKYSKVKQEVREVMGGYIIETEFDKAWERGVEEGMEKGIRIFIEDKAEDGVDVETIVDRLLSHFELKKPEAEEYVRKYMPAK